jgi:sugar transferase (PEP-CTERM/EpsH1 system associated)
MIRTLFFAPRECRPTNTGGKLRNFHLCRELSKEAEVTYLSFADAGGHISHEPIGETKQIITVPKSGKYSPLKLARGLLGKTPFTVLNYTTDEMKQRLAQLLREESFDIVQIESLILMEYLPIIQAANPRPIIISDWHNVDSEVLERYADHAPDPARKMYARATARRLIALEKQAMTLFDAHLTVSDRDREHLLKLRPDATVFTIDNGTDISSFTLESGTFPPQQNRIIFVGSMDYHANIDAAQFFAHEVWPQIYSDYPDWKFTIVGRDPAASVRELAALPGIEVTGTVDDVRPYYRDALASVVPLRVGGGSRLKILEAMAARVPVVSTSLGAEGLEIMDGENILIHDNPADLVGALVKVAHDKMLRNQIVEAGYSLAVHRYDWAAIGKKLRGIHRQLVASRSTSKNGANE